MAEAYCSKSLSVVEIANEEKVDLLREDCEKTCENQWDNESGNLAVNLHQ
jgi:hypothetical protein